MAINRASGWTLSVVNFVLNAAQQIKAGLQTVPDFFYPDNPAPRLLNWIGSSLANVLYYVSPFILILIWSSAFRSIKRFYEADNKNFERCLDLFLSLGSAAVMTAIYALGLTASTYVFMHIAPILISCIFAVNAVLGLVNFMTNLYCAFKAKDREIRNQYLWKAVKELLSIITNTLGFVVGLFLGIKTCEAVELMNEGVDQLIQSIFAIGRYFEQMAPLVYALCVSAALGLAAETVELNLETLRAMRHPLETIAAWQREGSYLSLGLQLLILPFRLVALTLAPIQLFFWGIKTMWTRLFSAEEKPMVVSQENKNQEFKELVNKVKAKIQQLQAESASEKRTNKIDFLSKILTDKLGVTANDGTLEADACFKKEVSVNLIVEDFNRKSSFLCHPYQSFLGKPGGVKAIIEEDLRSFERRYYHS